MILRYTVPEGETRKVYNVLRKELAVSSTLVRRLKNFDAIKVDGETAFTDRILLAGQTLTVEIDKAEPEGDIVPENGEIDIIYEDDGFLAVNKPAGLIVHPTHSRYTGTLANFVSGYTKTPVHAVNRLDRDTSGVVLFSKNSYMKYRLIESDSEKDYLAVVYGIVPDDEGVIDAPIGRVEDGNILRAVMENGKPAVTKYKVVERNGETTVLSLRLLTGRTHQIRVHMAHIGFPLVGDTLYCSPESKSFSEKLGIKGQLLHAYRMSIAYPDEASRLELRAPVRREEMLRFVSKFEI